MVFQGSLGNRWQAEYGWIAVITLLFGYGLTVRSVAAQRVLPAWRISERPRFEVGRSDIDLHQVRAATALPDGGFAVADGGNSRILIFSAHGHRIREFGRDGAGPGEFRVLWDLLTAADTLIAYDPALHRTTVWKADGTLIGNVSLPRFKGRAVHLRAALSASEYLVSVPPSSGIASTGLVRDTAALLLWSSATEAVEDLGQVEWGFRYVYSHAGQASTAYRTPFLGETLVAAVEGRIAVVPLDSPVVEIRRRGRPLKRLRLPVQRRPFDRTVIDNHLDSLLIETQRHARFAAAPFAARLRVVFGEDFPAPVYEPFVREIRVLGPELWLNAGPTDGGGRVRWYVVDMVRERLAATVSVPRQWTILGGTDRLILVLRRDPAGVEYVAVHDVFRSNDPPK